MNKSSVVKYKIVKEPVAVYMPVSVTQSSDCAAYLREHVFDSGTLGVCEHFWVITINNRNRITGQALIGQGGIEGVVVDVRLIAKYAIETLATRLIVAHNHPSGNLRPSESDLKLTGEIKAALKLFNVNFLDHIILTEDSYYSFADEGKL